jgi:hypothetical protein
VWGGRVQMTPYVDVVRLAGIEPTTLGFGGQYSIH